MSAPATVTTKGAWDSTTADGATTTAPHHVLGPGAHLPVMTLRESAIANNIAVMQAFTERHDLLFAPHMKTHMAPDLAARQVAAGAWGVTVASVQQAMVAWEHGIHRILVANEVLDPAGIAWLATRRAVDPDADVLAYVDSEAGVAAAASAVASAAATAVAAAGAADDAAPALHVLVEVGFAGGRTGVRTDADALAVARAAHDAGLVVRGVSGYEGGLPTVDEARAYVERVLDVTREVEAAGLVDDDPVLLSMGGSAYFDAVADALDDRGDIAVVLRSGAYLTHDDGAYERKTPFHRIPEEGSLLAAIEVWARVTSTPEPGLALVAAGKRDLPFDEGLPVVREIRPGGAADVAGIVPPPGAVTVARMDDQHAYVAVDAAAGATLSPGDVVVLGISHPCTAFDKWRSVHMLADDDTVLDTIATWF